MKRSCPITQRIMAMLACSAIAATGYGQAVSSSQPTKTSSTTPVITDEEVTQLTPFEVNASKDNGYAATETLAGTRIRTNLADVGASISVLTKQFLQDIGATDNSTLLQYTTNTEVGGARGTYAGLGNGTSVDESGNLRSPQGAQRVRGLAAADNARDYYISDIPWDSFNIDRIDILRGPNSILFGLGSPAGIINASTRSAEFRNTGSLDLRTGSYGTVRSSIDLNQQIVPRVLALRIDGLWNDQKYEQKPAFQNDKRLFGALRFDPQLFSDRRFHTTIRAKYEHGEINANRPRYVPPNDSITPWWRPTAVSADNPFGGAGKTLVNNLYDPWRSDTANIVAGDGKGLIQSNTVNYQPWLSDFPNQQQPYWLIDGASNQTYTVQGGYINAGGRDSNGNLLSTSTGIPGKRTNAMFFGLGGLPGAVVAYNNANANNFPTAQYGQYRTMSLLDSSVFDFYHTLIDGPTKNEWENWNAYNISLSQTGWDDRIGLDFSYDRQKYRNGAQQLLGGAPSLTLDINKQFLDGSANINVGRPFVKGADTNGGRSYSSDREYERVSLFAELRATDFAHNDFLVKLLGKHRFNGVYSDESFKNEQRTWQLYANSQAWAGYWNANSGSSQDIGDRAPQAMIYLGGPVTGRSSASGADIPGIQTNITLPDSGVYLFDPTWANYSVKFGDPYTLPASQSTAFNPDTSITQASNTANMVGWNAKIVDQLLRYNNGENLGLLKSAQKSQRVTKSYSGSYQGFLWNNALVATLGWRYDEVKTRDVNAANVTLNRNMLNLAPNVYRLPDQYPANQIVKGHSTSGGAVLHINRVLPRDFLPINVSLSYNESSNFQVTSVRRDLYGHPIGNPAGKTYEYGALLATKDNKFSFRVTKYTTRVKDANSGISDPGGIGRIIQQGLRWRNVLLYQLGAYTFDTRNQPSSRNNWNQAYPNLSPDQALAATNAAITTWNNIQKKLAPTGFFQAWNFTPTGPDTVLVDRSTYLTDPTKYAPDPATVSPYTAVPGGPQGFTVTADTESRGYEYELTANPLPNWRIAFNASKTEAIRRNVGGQVLTDYVAYIDSQLYNADGTATPAGQIAQFGNPSFALASNVWGPWRANYVLMKLQEGTPSPELRKWRYNVVTNYTFRQGILKGAGVGGAYRWQDKVVIGYPTTSKGQFDLTKPYFGPSEDAIDLFASYERKITKKINWRVQLNVYNVGKKEGLIPISIEPDGKTWATARIAPVQEWMLSNTFSF